MYSILGHNVNFRKGDDEQEVSPEDVTAFLDGEISVIKEKNPSLSDDKIAILLLLKLAEEKLVIAKEYREGLSKLKFTTCETLAQIESAIIS
jgi:cell division protein ZapA (FtsZ GTPase activity inhibitor)